MLFALTALFSQNAEKALADTSAVKAHAGYVLGLLYDNDWISTDWISWEDFTLNENYLGYDYLDAYDAYEEDYFMEDKVKDISGQLHYDGDDKDSFSKFTIENKDDYSLIRAHNKKKFVRMVFKPQNDEKALLYEITISDVKK
jgi:hypothetical protein